MKVSGRMQSVFIFIFTLSMTLLAATTTSPQKSPPVTALSRLNAPIKYKSLPFPFVKSDAPKGGALKLSTVGTFDMLNPFIMKGTCAEGLAICYEKMMQRSVSEPFTLYPQLAEHVELAPDFFSITFFMHPKAPLNAHDAKYTWETLRDKGPPRYKHFYKNVKDVVVVDERTVRVEFNVNEKGVYDSEIPLIFALFPILSKAQLEKIDFSNSGMAPLIGSGPYRVGAVEQGHFVTLERNLDYWGRDLPVNQGMYNYDRIRIDYYKNAQAQLQAFAAGEFDIMFETNPNQWITGYEDMRGIKSGQIVRVSAPHTRQVLVRTLLMNMKKELFKNWHVRKALTLAFDFDEMNKRVFDGLMKSPCSLFANTHLAHNGKLEGAELALLERYKDQIDPEIYAEMTTDSFKTSIPGQRRMVIEKALEYLKKAGYTIQKGVCMNTKGEPLKFEILIKDPRLEKIALTYKESLKILGIELTVRMVDTVQYENRVSERDFDMIVHAWANSLSPGSEQSYYFSQEMADKNGSSNYMGLKDFVAEALAKGVGEAQNHEAHVAAVRVMDRYVMHMAYQVPLNYDPVTRWSYWKNRITYPQIDSDVGLDVMRFGWALTPLEKEVVITAGFMETIKGWMKSIFG